MDSKTIYEQISKVPFEPFRIRFNGDSHDVLSAGAITIQRNNNVFIAYADQTWAVFGLEMICSLECLISDFLARDQEHNPREP